MNFAGFISQLSVSSLRLTRSLFAASSHVLETPDFVQPLGSFESMRSESRCKKMKVRALLC